MPSRKVPDDHHTARHCTAKDFVTDEMAELNRDAYKPTNDNPDISVSWLEYHDGDFEARLKAICKDLLGVRRRVRRNHKLAVLQVDWAKKIGKKYGHMLSVRHNPDGPNESHALIIGIPLLEVRLHQELADAASENIHSVPLWGER